MPVCHEAKFTVGCSPKRFQQDREISMEPVGVSRKLALMPAGHAKGRVEPLRLATSIRKILEIHHAEVDARADGEKSHKCEKTHIFAAWALV